MDRLRSKNLLMVFASLNEEMLLDILLLLLVFHKSEAGMYNMNNMDDVDDIDNMDYRYNICSIGSHIQMTSYLIIHDSTSSISFLIH